VESRLVLAAYALLALLVAFYPAFFGELPVPATAVLTLLPGGPAPPETNELADVPTEFLPWSRAVADSYRSGHLPLRFAANGCGTPLWANPQAQAVTPTTLFHLALPESWASALAAALKLFLAAAGAFLFVRSRRIGRVAAAFAGFAFGFSLFFTTWMHFPHSYAHAWLPWSLLAVERLASGLPGGFRATLAVVVLLLLGGYPEGEFYVAVAASAFFALVLAARRPAPREALSRLGLAAAAAVLGAGLTAAYVLPAAFAVSRGERSRLAEISSGAPGQSLSLSDFGRPPTYWTIARFWVVPEAQGNPRDGDKFGPYSFAGRTSGYAGILVLALALGTFFRRRPGRTVVVCRIVIAILVLYLLWYRPLRFVLERTPGLREVSLRLTTNRAAEVLVLLLALLSAAALDRLRDGKDRNPARAGVALALAGVTAVGIEYVSAAGRPAVTPVRAFSFLFPVVALGALLFLLFRRDSLRTRRAIVALVVIGTAIDLLRIGARFNPGTPPELYYPMTPQIRQLQTRSQGGRFATSESTMTGVAFMYGLEDVRAHDPVASADYAEALAATAGYTGLEDYAARVKRLDAPFLTFLNVRALLASDGEVRGAAGRPAILPERLEGVPDTVALTERLSRETDFTKTAYAIGASESFSGDAAVLWMKRVRPDKIRIGVRTTAPRLLVLPETNDGGWTAESQGTPYPTLLVNRAFLGVRVPAGERTIVCRYVPPGMRAGFAASAFSLAVLAGLAIGRRVRSPGRRSDRAPTAVPDDRSPDR